MRFDESPERPPSRSKGPPPERFQSARRPLILGGRDERSDRLFSLVVALLLLPLALPLIAVVALGVLLTGGRPLLHRGLRLGRSKRPFVMYKFRTLRTGASTRRGARLMAASDREATPIGEFLRRTRLDELPQLFNVLRGDMALVGPRPERPEVYETFCRFIPGYERRFAVRPGLIGQSQLFTPHGTPKRMRSLIDNAFLRRNHAWARDLLVVGVALFYLARGLVVRCWRAVRRSLGLFAKNGSVVDQRAMERAALASAVVLWEGGTATLININEEALLFAATEPIAPFPPQFVLETPTRRRNGTRLRRARIAVRALCGETRWSDGRYAYVVGYEPLSPFNDYLIHQYFLTESIIGPHQLCR